MAAGLSNGPGGIAVLMCSAGIVQFVFGSLVRRLRVFFPPEVCGVVVIMLGVSLLPGTLRGIVTQSVNKTFLHVEPAGLAVALVTLAVASAGSVWLKGMARFFSLLLGCVAGMIVAYALGIWQFGTTSTPLDVPALALPSIHLPGFSFNIGPVHCDLRRAGWHGHGHVVSQPEPCLCHWRHLARRGHGGRRDPDRCHLRATGAEARPVAA